MPDMLGPYGEWAAVYEYNMRMLNELDKKKEDQRHKRNSYERLKALENKTYIPGMRDINTPMPMHSFDYRIYDLLLEEADNHPDPLYGESLKRCLKVKYERHYGGNYVFDV
jgi:hypothetical protein